MQELPRDAESITLRPVQLDDGSVEVLIERSSKTGDREQIYRSTVVAKPGEWVQLLGRVSPAAQSQTSGTTFGTSNSTSASRVKLYGTQSAGGRSLYLNVATP